MTKKEDLQKQLQELEARLLEIRDKEGQTEEDLKTANGVCDQIEELNENLRTLERMDRTVEGVRAPVGEPGGLEQPDNRENQGFESFGENLIAILRASVPGGQVDRRLIRAPREMVEERSTGMEESTPSLGGFLVQTDFSNQLITKTHETSVLYNRVRKIPISAKANGLKIPGVDETSREDGSRWGGVRVYWLEEGGTKTASYPKYRIMELSLKKMAGICYLTDELMNDAPAIGAYVSQAFADEFGFKLDDAIINGTGAGQPLGILNAPCLVSISKETGQAADTILWDNIKKMYARLYARGRSNMLWLINQDCLPQLMSMTQPVGTGGVPVWLPAGAASGKPYDTLLGKPSIEIEQCQTVGTKGDIYLVDLSQYIMIEKGGMQSAVSIHVRFINDETVFRFVFRTDGQPLWNAALTPYKGSNTVGPFLALNSRD